MPATCTVFQAEIEEISHACQYALAQTQEHDIKYIKILSDSQAAILALDKLRIMSKAVLTVLEYIEILAAQVDHLTLVWIKAHVSTEEKEQADQAAEEGAAGGQNLNKTNKHTHAMASSKKIEKYTNNKWTNRLQTEQQYKHTKLFYASPNKHKTKHITQNGNAHFNNHMYIEYH